MNVSHYIHQVGFGRYFDKRPNPLSSLPVGIEEVSREASREAKS